MPSYVNMVEDIQSFESNHHVFTKEKTMSNYFRMPSVTFDKAC